MVLYRDMLTVGELQDAFFLKDILISDQAIKKYCRGFWEPFPGQKKYYDFYPNVMPHTRDERGWLRFEFEPCYAWLQKYKTKFFFPELIVKQKKEREKKMPYKMHNGYLVEVSRRKRSR